MMIYSGKDTYKGHDISLNHPILGLRERLWNNPGLADIHDSQSK